MDELAVTLPYARLRETALRLGSQDSTACPPVCCCRHKRERMDSYFSELGLIDAECPDCWLHFLLLGD
jgi:hypothetical protein